MKSISESYYICILSLFILITFSSPLAHACPTTNNLIDYNCDQNIKFAVTGDSIVYGIGDEDFDNQGGYVTRLARRIKTAEVVNLGVPGITSSRLLRAFKKNLNKEKGETITKSRETDLFIIAVGINDYFSDRPPGLTVRNIRRLVKFLRQELPNFSTSSPYIVVSTLTSTTRDFQLPFVEEVNRLLISYSSSSLPVYLRFEQLDTSLLGEDGLHPTSTGYSKMADIVSGFVKNECQNLMLQKRPDKDKDGIYDIFERKIFGTLSRFMDTDGDGVSDGDEVFLYSTNPLLSENVF